jgi:hypothetical protein
MNFNKKIKPMTPKEKTIQLVERFKHFDEYYYDEFFKDTDLAKQCALIAVDEILKTNPYKARNYWHEVKTEIEKL